MEINLNKFNTILEIGVNHEGSVENAIKIMKLGAEAGGKILNSNPILLQSSYRLRTLKDIKE